jgi:hypothetical protein
MITVFYLDAALPQQLVSDRTGRYSIGDLPSLPLRAPRPLPAPATTTQGQAGRAPPQPPLLVPSDSDSISDSIRLGLGGRGWGWGWGGEGLAGVAQSGAEPAHLCRRRVVRRLGLWATRGAAVPSDAADAGTVVGR